ncbi:tail tape measure protein [Brucella pseudintermedia]|uniref:tail tape measure protein n=1 Tax=Brucella pseudintermedia TaxID=370111 RepID=UPI00366E88DD|nr:tail tape measure protein [Brucella pseudintermedia]
MERRTNKAAKNMESSLSRGFSKMQGLVASFGKGLLAGVAAGGIAGLASSVMAVTKSFSELGKEAKTAGLNVEDFQRWRYVADQNLISVDALTDAFKELSLRADEYVQTGKGSAAESFQRLGMSPQEVKERLKDPSTFMLELIERTRQLKDTAAGIRLFDELLGGQGGEVFVRLIEQGRAGISATIAEADKMGIIFDQEWIDKAAEIDKKFNQISTTVGATLKGAIVSATESLIEFIDKFRDLERQQRSTLQNRQTAIMGEKNSLVAEINAAKAERDALAKSGGGSPGILSGQIQELEQRFDQLNAEEDKIIAILSQRTEAEAQANKALKPTFQPFIPPKEPNKGGSKKSADDRARDAAAKAAERERKAVQDLIADLQFEASLVGKSALEKEKLTALRHAGAAATAAEKAQIEQLVEANYKATEAFDKQQAAIQEVNDAGREFAGTLVSGLLSGAKASDVLSDALGRLADRFLNSGLDALFGGGGGIGGIFSSIFGGGSSDPWSGLRLAGGGHVRGSGGPRSDSIPAMLSNGEYVINAAATKKFGPLLDAINSGKGLALAGGGAVGMPAIKTISAPRIPDLRSMTHSNTNAPTIAPVWNIDARGADVAAVARLEQVVARQQAEFEGRVVATMRKAKKTRNWRGN